MGSGLRRLPDGTVRRPPISYQPQRPRDGQCCSRARRVPVRDLRERTILDRRGWTARRNDRVGLYARARVAERAAHRQRSHSGSTSRRARRGTAHEPVCSAGSAAQQREHDSGAHQRQRGHRPPTQRHRPQRPHRHPRRGQSGRNLRAVPYDHGRVGCKYAERWVNRPAAGRACAAHPELRQSGRHRH